MFHEQKKTLLEAFLESQSISSDLWQEFRERIAFNAGETVVNDNRLFEGLCELESFKNKGTLIKPARWFSWNQCSDEILLEFHTLKMLANMNSKTVFVHWMKLMKTNRKMELDSVSWEQDQAGVQKTAKEDEYILRSLEMKKSVDPRKQLDMLKKLCGGFKFAYKLMTEELYGNCRLLASITRPLWD